MSGGLKKFNPLKPSLSLGRAEANSCPAQGANPAQKSARGAQNEISSANRPRPRVSGRCHLLGRADEAPGGLLGAAAAPGRAGGRFDGKRRRVAVVVRLPHEAVGRPAAKKEKKNPLSFGSALVLVRNAVPLHPQTRPRSRAPHSELKLVVHLRFKSCFQGEG